jgi:hypothetical protein
MCRDYIFIRHCQCPHNAWTHSLCGSEHCNFVSAHEKIDTEGLSIAEIVYHHPEDQIILTDFPCSRCLTERVPEHFFYETWIENAIAIACPIIVRAMDIPGFLKMELRVRKFPSRFRLEGQDLVWLYNTRELVQLATHWMIEHQVKTPGVEKVFRRVYNTYLAVVEYNMIADIEGTKAPEDTGTPEWFILLRGLSEVGTPEI